MKLKPEDLGRLGEEGYYILKDKKGTMPSGETYTQIMVSKRYNEDLVKVIKEKQDGTSIVQFAKDNRVEVVKTDKIETHEKPMNSWD